MDESPKKIWKENYRVRQDDVDRAGKLRISSVFHFMQDLAVCHADHLGFGMEGLRAHNLMWVLSRLKIHFTRTPNLGETLLAETWPAGIQKIFAVREFRFRAPGGEDLARATSFWLLLDATNFRPKRIAESLPCSLPDNSDLPVCYAGLDKLLREETADPQELSVPESAIDVNQHMNNTCYVTCAYDWLARKIKSTPVVSEIQVNFVAATPVYTLLTVAGKADAGMFYAEITEGTTLHCQVSGKYAV